MTEHVLSSPWLCLEAPGPRISPFFNLLALASKCTFPTPATIFGQKNINVHKFHYQFCFPIYLLLTSYEYDDPNFQKLLYNLRCLTSGNLSGILPQLFPYVIYLPPYRRNLKRNIFLRTFIEDVVEEHRASLDPNDVRDIIDMFLLEVDKGKVGDNGVIFDKSRVWRTIFDLFGAGTDTTSNSLLWAIAIFCHYPDVQKKVRA